MDNQLRSAQEKYFNTLDYKGIIDSKETFRLFVMQFLYDYINKGFVKNEEIVKKINFLIDCLTSNTCLFTDKFMCIGKKGLNNRFTYTFPFEFTEPNLCSSPDGYDYFEFDNDLLH